MFVARRYVVRGRVQGVGFRFFVEQAAGVEGLAGWVTNRPDGTVEVHAEGEVESLQRFEGKLRQGPSRAQIDRVTIEDDVPGGTRGGFHVR
jgi:acylphosphatase